jgi:hypothetical protein
VCIFSPKNAHESVFSRVFLLYFTFSDDLHLLFTRSFVIIELTSRVVQLLRSSRKEGKKSEVKDVDSEKVRCHVRPSVRRLRWRSHWSGFRPASHHRLSTRHRSPRKVFFLKPISRVSETESIRSTLQMIMTPAPSRAFSQPPCRRSRRLPTMTMTMIFRIMRKRMKLMTVRETRNENFSHKAIGRSS